MITDRTNFFAIKNVCKLSQLINLHKNDVIKKSINLDYEIKDISSLKKIKNNSLLFIKKKIFIQIILNIMSLIFLKMRIF